MTLNSDVRLGRLTASPPNPAKATIVYGAYPGGYGETPMVELLRIKPAISDGRCGLASAKATKGTTGLTYFVFEAPPGIYVANYPYSQPTLLGQTTFVVTPGKQLYIGDFSSTMFFTRDLAAAKSSLGPGAANLELAELGEPAQGHLLGFVCLPPQN